MAEPEKQGQLAVLKDAFGLVRREKPVAYLWCGLTFIATLVGGYFAGVGLGHPIYFGILAIPLALLAAFFTFTRFANSAAFSSIEGQIGAGASVLMSIRKGFTTTPAVSAARNQDMVHRTVGRAGIILVGEGTPAVRSLVLDEKKKVERFVPGVPVHEIYVGNYDGAVPIRKLQKVVKKFPKKLSKAQLREVRNRLKGVGGMAMPIPKGPMPKGVKLPKR
ncbi:MAG: DUF4191 domain-containing protein [Actinomycetes bacterium]